MYSPVKQIPAEITAGGYIIMKKLVLVAAVLVIILVFAGCDYDLKEENAIMDSKQSYTITYIEGQPSWDDIPVAYIDNQQWMPSVDITAYAQLCYSDDALFVRMWAEEEDIRAEYPKSDVLGHTYEDSCLEFFFAPVSGDERYMNFEYNPNGCVCVQIGKNKEERIRMAFEEDIFAAEPERIDGGWEITYTIPFSFLRNLYPDFQAESGKQITGNFYKCGNLTAQKHYISWNPIDSETPNFHRPEDFGILIFE